MRSFGTLMGAAALLLASAVGSAQTTWTGAVNTSWSNGANWSAGAPTPVQSAVIAAGAPRYPVISGVESCLDITVQNLASVTIPTGQTLDIHGSVSLLGQYLGNGRVRLRGSGTVTMTPGRTFPTLEVDATGFYSLTAVYILNGFTLTNGIARFDGAGSNIFGNANFLGGELQGVPGQLPPLFCRNNVVFSNCTVTSNPAMQVFGDWTSDSFFQPTAGAVAFDGPGTRTVTAVGSVFFIFGILPGTSVNSTTGTISVSGSYLAFGTLNPSVVVRAAGTNPIIIDQMGVPIPNLQINCTGICRLEGDIEILGSLTQLSGILLLANPSEIRVGGAAFFSGGTLAAESPFDGLLYLDGLATFNGTTVGVNPPIVLSQGPWVSDSNYAPAAVFTIFYGLGTQTVSCPGSTFFFAFVGGLTTLDVVGGPMRILGTIQHEGAFTSTSTLQLAGTPQVLVSSGGSYPDVEILGNVTQINAVTINGNLTVQAGGDLDIGSQDLSCLGATHTVSGALRLDAGGDLILAPTSSCTVAPTGSLELHGQVGTPATVRTQGGIPGYSFTVNGSISAQNFLARDMGPAGFVVSNQATIAAAPFDFRAGTFDAGASGPGSTLLSVSRNSPASIRYASFPNAGSTAANMTSSGPAIVTMVNWTGAFAGPAFENDPGNFITWSAPSQTTLSVFNPVPGRERVDVVWGTSLEVDAVEFFLERSTSMGGPFTLLAQPAASGPGSYPTVPDAPLTGNVTYWYRLSERLTHGAIRVLALTSACPWANVTPPTVLTVGAGGAFSTIQAAINTVNSAAPAIIQVAPGTYPPFTILDLPGIDINIRVIGDGTGTATIDTTSGPIQIVGPNNYFDRIELSDLTIGSLMSPNPGIVIVNSDPSVILLDELTVMAGSGQPALSVNTSSHVSLQSTVLNGNPGLLATGLSIITQAGGTVTGGTTLATSNVNFRRCGATGMVTVAPGAIFTDFAGVMPTISLAEFAQAGTTVPLGLTGRPGFGYSLALSPHIDWIDTPSPGVSMVGLILLTDPSQIIASGTFDGSGVANLPLIIPPQKALLGIPLSLQFVDYQPGDLRWSTVASIVPMP